MRAFLCCSCVQLLYSCSCARFELQLRAITLQLQLRAFLCCSCEQLLCSCSCARFELHFGRIIPLQLHALYRCSCMRTVTVACVLPLQLHAYRCSCMRYTVAVACIIPLQLHALYRCSCMHYTVAVACVTQLQLQLHVIMLHIKHFSHTICTLVLMFICEFVFGNVYKTKNIHCQKQTCLCSYVSLFMFICEFVFGNVYFSY